MKFLIAGFGSIGRRHFRNLLALGEQDILFYRSGRSTLPDDELRGYTVEYNLDAALAHHPEAVIVANPTALHLEVAIPAAEAGCHLFLEKPLSHSLERIDDLQAAVQRSGSRVLTGFQYRFHPGLRQVRRLLEQGEISRPLSVRVQWGEYLPGWHPWEDYRRGYSARADLGGGVTLTLCHPLDYLRWLLGEINTLWAFTGKLGDLELDVEDTAEIGLRFAGGMLGSLHLDYNQRPPVHRMEISGSAGTLHWDNGNGYIADGSLRLYRAAVGEWQEFPPPPSFERNTMFLEQMSHFVQVARGEAAPACSLEDGVQALRLALAVHRSQAEEKVIHF
jgi:predicted dehydrogenase